MMHRQIQPFTSLSKALPPHLAGSVLLLTILFGLTLPLQAGEPKVFTVRPEKIEAARGQKTASLPLARDPFNWNRDQISSFKNQESREKSNSVGGLTLSGIIWDKSKPQAIINDRLVTKGETIGDSVIQQILKDLVIFEQNGIANTLWLESSPMPLPMKDKKH